METLKAAYPGTGAPRASSMVRCPACGAVMLEEDRSREGGYVFIWFGCSKKDCGGQWLQKKPQFSVIGRV